MQLSEFLVKNPVNNLTKEVYVSDRFVDENGNKLPFKIKAMSGDAYASYRKEALRITKNGADFDTKRFNELVVINHTIDPNFRDAEAIKAAGCVTPEQYMYRSLLAGEIDALAAKISELSGFNVTIEEAKETVKNS